MEKALPMFDMLRQSKVELDTILSVVSSMLARRAPFNLYTDEEFLDGHGIPAGAKSICHDRITKLLRPGHHLQRCPGHGSFLTARSGPLNK